MKITKCVQILIGLFAVTALAGGPRSSDLSPEECLYLPPSFADRVLFYDGFEHPDTGPEINRINARVTGAQPIQPNGFAGAACQSSQPQRGEKPFEIHSDRLSGDRPITIMRWFCTTAAMKEDSSFQLLALLGKGHISCFIRGKGEWCALQRPTMFVQVDHIPSITNVNWAVLDNAYFKPGEWHHIALSIANSSELCFYLDGKLLATIHLKGRPLAADDLETLQASSDSGNYAEHSTLTDELIVVDHVLSESEIGSYCQSSLQLKQLGYPPVLPAEIHSKK